MNKPITKAQVREFKNKTHTWNGKEATFVSTGKFLNRRQRRSLKHGPSN